MFPTINNGTKKDVNVPDRRPTTACIPPPMIGRLPNIEPTVKAANIASTPYITCSPIFAETVKGIKLAVSAF